MGLTNTLPFVMFGIEKTRMSLTKLVKSTLKMCV